MIGIISEETKHKTKIFTVLNDLFSSWLNTSLHQNTNSLPKHTDCTFLGLSLNGTFKTKLNISVNILFHNQNLKI